MSTTTDPNISYYQTVQNDLASGNPQTALVGALGAQAGPQVAQTELQTAQAEQQLGDLGPLLGMQSQYAEMMAGYQLGGEGIQAEQTALQQQGTEQAYGLQQQSFQQQAQQNQLNYTRSLQNQIGGSAASGALNTVGSKQGQADIGQQYAWQQAGLGRQEQQAAGDYARAQQNYQLIGQANGLSQQEVYARLQYGLQQLGINADPTSIVAQAGSALAGGATDVGSVLAQAGLMGGLNALSGLG